MKKGDQNKLNLFLAGIQARLEQNRDYFTDIQYTFRAGKKTFAGSLVPAQTGYRLTFQGVARPASAADATAFFAREAGNYEEATLQYRERGAQLTIQCNARGVQLKQSERPAQAAPASEQLAGGREYLIRVDQAGELLREIGVLTAEGKLKNDKIRKYNQIDHYVELVAPMFQKDDSKEILLLDCACGKSYLSFVMNYYLRDVLRRRCRVSASTSIRMSSRKAAKWPNVWVTTIWSSSRPTCVPTSRPKG